GAQEVRSAGRPPEVPVLEAVEGLREDFEGRHGSAGAPRVATGGLGGPFEAPHVDVRMIRVAVAGASGYMGAELLRVLLQHPEVARSAVTSERLAGGPLARLYPHLRRRTE